MIRTGEVRTGAVADAADGADASTASPSARRCGSGRGSPRSRFGGPAGQIAVMHRILVEEKRWIGEERFLHALNYCMLLPGPEAQQLAIYIGWLMHRTKGGLVAGMLFVLPGVVAIMALSLIYAAFGKVGDRPGAVLRPEGGGAGDRARGGAPDRQARAEEPGHGRASRPPPSSRSSSSTCRSR